MSAFRGEKIWRMLTNFWTVVLISFLTVNFLTHNSLNFITPTLSIIYTGALTLYAGTKEFDRWYNHHLSRHPGEWFIIVWTIFFGAIVSVWLFLGSSYKLPPEAVADYVMVLTIFALTQKSKHLHGSKERNGEEPRQ